jgi:outer membrane protein TolC
MTLRQALELALAQSPEVTLARLDQQRARYQVTIAHDPFSPKVFAGSGAAYTNGFPASIDGAAPAIFQAKTQMAIFDRPQTYQIRQANENLRGSGIEVGRQQDEVAYRVASLFLDAEQATQSLAAAQREAENLTRVRELVGVRVSEGRELPIKSKEADLAVLRARQRVDALGFDLSDAETSLAVALGLSAEDRVRAAQEERPAVAVPGSEEQTIAEAIANNRDLKRLESNLQAKTLEIKGYRAMRLPKVNLIAQYERFAQYYYQGFYPKFQSNSVQLGASFDVPLLVGRAPRAYASQAETDMAKIRVEEDRTRTRIAADLHRAFQDVARADGALAVARLDLDLARDQLSVDLAQMDEGRIPMAAVEQARAVEQDKWLVYYAAQHTVERSRLNVLRQTGTLAEALK